jgi:hypothetical protein
MKDHNEIIKKELKESLLKLSRKEPTLLETIG